MVCREIIRSFEKADRIHAYSPYTMFVSKRSIPTGMELSNQDAMQRRNPGMGYTPPPSRGNGDRPSSSRRPSSGVRPFVQSERPAWGGVRRGSLDRRARTEPSTEIRGQGMGYNFPERFDPNISGEERSFRQAFNSMGTQDKRKFVQKVVLLAQMHYHTRCTHGCCCCSCTMTPTKLSDVQTHKPAAHD